MSSADFLKEPNANVQESQEPQEFGDVVNQLGFGWYQKRMLIMMGMVWSAEAAEIFLLTFIRNEVINDVPGATDSLLSLTTTLVFAGMFVGSLSFGAISDLIGRKKTIFVVICIPIIGGLATVFSTNIYMFMACQTLAGFGIGGGHVAPALLMELLPAANRELYIVISYSWWTIGVLLLCLEAFLLRDLSWRYLAGVAVIPSVLCLMCYPLLNESPRWLRIHNREEEAMEILRKIARVNNVEISNRPLVVAVVESTLNTREKLAVLFDKTLRKQTATLWVIWASASAAYYGMVMLSTQQLVGKHSGGASYAGAALEALGESPAYPLLYLCSNKIGRRKPLIAAPLVAAVFLVLLKLTETDDRQFSNVWYILEIGCAFISRCAALFMFDLVYMYTPEVYPTTVRSTALGTCSGSSRVASLGTPFIAYGLQSTNPYAPYALFGCLLLLSSGAGFLLEKETLAQELPDSHTSTPALGVSPVGDESAPLIVTADD